jgi:hypothetical protein
MARGLVPEGPGGKPGAQMADYFFYRFDRDTGLASTQTLCVEDDAEARRLAAERANDADYELWFGIDLIAFRQAIQ